MQVKDVVRAMETLAPIGLKEDWDNVGLQIGGPNDSVHKILLALTPCEKVVAEAIAVGADMIITHHPWIFKGIKTLRSDTVIGRMSRACIKHDIAMYCAHTNLDIADGGVNDILAKRLGLVDVQGLQQSVAIPRCKVVVFVPLSHLEVVKMAMFRAGAGTQGDYQDCAWTVTGVGQFCPKDGAHPFVGRVGQAENVEEARLEVLVDAGCLTSVISAMKEAHPYEEVAYDVFVNEGSVQRSFLGRVGRLPEAMPLEAWLLKVKEALGLPVLTYAGDTNAAISKVALCGGSACDLLPDAKAVGADVFVTGDMKYHDAQRALEMGMVMVDVSHYSGERPVLEALQTYLQISLGDGVEICLSVEEENFIKYLN